MRKSNSALDSNGKPQVQKARTIRKSLTDIQQNQKSESELLTPDKNITRNESLPLRPQLTRQDTESIINVNPQLSSLYWKKVALHTLEIVSLLSSILLGIALTYSPEVYSKEAKSSNKVSILFGKAILICTAVASFSTL